MSWRRSATTAHLRSSRHEGNSGRGHGHVETTDPPCKPALPHPHVGRGRRIMFSRAAGDGPPLPPPPAVFPHRENRDATGAQGIEQTVQNVGGPSKVIEHFAHHQHIGRFGWMPGVEIGMHPGDRRERGPSRAGNRNVLRRRAPCDVECGGGEVDARVRSDWKAPDVRKKLSGAASQIEDTRPLAVVQSESRRHGETMCLPTVAGVPVVCSIRVRPVPPRRTEPERADRGEAGDIADVPHTIQYRADRSGKMWIGHVGRRGSVLVRCITLLNGCRRVRVRRSSPRRPGTSPGIVPGLDCVRAGAAAAAVAVRRASAPLTAA